ncbi:MAG: hypothetical protein F9K18_10765 [Thermoanaerobaculia bacterium]|nr:MAG: hypothetical protein F9K18_10765 [Thermoanaerobaculia bacterium]
MHAWFRMLMVVAALLPGFACARPAGEATTAAAIEIPGLPGYPGAIELEHESGAAHWGYHQGSLGRRMVVAAPIAEVEAFYERALAEQGWTVLSASEQDGALHWHLYQGSSLGDIELSPRPDGRVEIHLERHDH